MHIQLRPVAVLPYDPLRDACHDIQDGAVDLMRLAKEATDVTEAWAVLTHARILRDELDRVCEVAGSRVDTLLEAQ